MHAVVFGASRGVGYYSTLYLLQSDPTATISVLLRTPAKLEKDERMASFIAEGRLKLFKGNALNKDDVKALFSEKCDLVISSMGSMDGKLTLSGIKFKGAQDPCSGPVRVLLPILKDLQQPRPRVVFCTTMGIGGTHDCMPLIHRIGYGWVLNGPHKDKEGVEYALFRASSVLPTPAKLPLPEIIPQDAIDALPENFIEELIIVRPAWFVGEEVEPKEGDAKPKVGERITVSTVKRAEVGRFIVDSCLPGDQTWVNKQPIIGF